LADLWAELDRLREENERLQAQLTAALAEIERLKRGSKRQATPFSKGTRAPRPGKPGRKPGAGLFTHRDAPAPEAVTTLVTVPVERSACPGCGGALLPDGQEVVTITDLPALLQPTVSQYHLARCRCARCGRSVRARHPAVAPDQRGATAHRLGPRVLAAAHWLHYGLGVPVRKLPALLFTLTGVEVTQGALTQDALRRAAREVGQAYAALRLQVRQAPAAYTDDSGWKVGGESAFLMTFTTEDTTVFQIRRRHRNHEVREVLPGDYAGVLVSDRAPSYDAAELSAVKQQKCLAHVQRSLTAALEDQWGRARHFPRRLQALLSTAIDLWHRYQAGAVTTAQLAVERARLQAAVTEHLRARRLTDRTNQKLLNELGWHHDRGNLLRFLFEPGVEPTNNRAERALRPAVIARKVSQCSKNEAGATAHAAFASVCVTLRQRGVGSLVAALAALFRTGAVATPT
jgi:transposase